MDSKLETLVASSIAEAFELAIGFIDEWAYRPSYCWFRGSVDRRLTLQPGASWRRGYNELETLVDFAQRGVAFADVGRIDEWNTYYLAQHHRIPTRLLDWTESFAAALFFAFDGWNGRTTPAVWILQPAALNETFLSWYGVLDPDRQKETEIWLPPVVDRKNPVTRQDEEGYVYDNRWPLAIYPKWTNERITAQQGMFTVHGRDPAPLVDLVTAAGKDPRDHIARIDLRGFRRRRVYSELAMLGIRRSSVFPDMDNFVTELKQQDGW